MRLRRRLRARRLRHELHVLADAPAPHRDRPRPARLRASSGRRSTSSSPSTTTTSRSPRTSPGCRSTTQSERRPDMTMTAPKPTTTAEVAAKPARPSTRVDDDRPRKADRTYDAIVIGGGHNGLVNGAYLAKSGLKTLILERRHLVGGAAITEELRPGFWFTTFSYALSLLRPDIIHDLELTKHGFMPLLMSTTFAPDGERRLPAGSRRTTARTSRRSRATPSTTPTPTTSTATTSRWSARPSSRCSTWSRPTSSATTPRSCSRWRRLGSPLPQARQARRSTTPSDC